MDRYAFDTLWTTLNAAVPRVLPLIWKFPPPTAEQVYDVYVALNPAITVYLVTHALVWGQLLLAAVTRSYAWNDRLWSLIPPAYALVFALHPVLSSDVATRGLPDVRLAVMATLVLLWGCRLTKNAVRRGVYSKGAIDHRYEYLRSKFSTGPFKVMYFLTVWATTSLLMIVTAPLYIAWVARGGDQKLNKIDVCAALGCVLSLAAQSISDNTQWNFQKRKKAKKTQDQFCTQGPFKWCRHPAYMAEISFWTSFFGFAVASAPIDYEDVYDLLELRYIAWAAAGAAAYVVLFVAVSVPLTEHISAEKYKAYAQYQKDVYSLVPFPPFLRWRKSAAIPAKKEEGAVEEEVSVKKKKGKGKGKGKGKEGKKMK